MLYLPERKEGAGRSASGAGTTFDWVELLQPEEPKMNWKETVVILDDDPGTAMYMQETIGRIAPEWNVVVAASPEEALGHLTRNPVSSLVTDLQMPRQDGIAMARQVRALDERSQTFRYVLMVTGHRQEARLESLEFANDFLTKPAEPREVVALLRHGLRLSRTTVEFQTRVEELGRLAATDPLTGLCNRRNGQEVLDKELGRWFRNGTPLSVLILDLDHFKRVNDEFGHDAGDQVLRQTAERMRESLRPFDTVARWGGEEFLVILPHTHEPEARTVAERLRNRLHPAMSLEGGRALVVTASIGVASVQTGVQMANHLVELADRALYRAKREGRDRVSVASENESASEVVGANQDRNHGGAR